MAALLVLAVAACGARGEDAAAAEPCDSTPAVNPATGLIELRDCPEGPAVVVLPPGRYRMGSAAGEEQTADIGPRPPQTISAEKPQVEVEIAYPFAIGKYEVTFAEWDRCVEAGRCTYRPKHLGWRRREDHPVVHIARRDAEEYLDWLSEVTGERYRLPSEEEWEYAARGRTRTAYYWGDRVGVNRAVCDGCGSRWDEDSTAPVGSFPPNPFGLYDMLGNASEWTSDCWSPDHTDAPRDGSPREGVASSWRDGECVRPVKRGGTYSTYAWATRAAARSSWRPGPWTDRERDYGFRVVREVDPSLLSRPGARL